MGMYERLASPKKMQDIANRVFYSSVLKTKEGEMVEAVEPGATYMLHSKETDKKVGWIKLPSEPGRAGIGWCNFPAYLKMPKPPVEALPDYLAETEFDEVPLGEYGLEDYARELPDFAEPEDDDDFDFDY